MDAIFIIVGIAIGAIASWFIAKYYFSRNQEITKDDLERKYIIKELYQKLNEDFKVLESQIKEKDSEILSLNKQLASGQQIIKNLNEKLEEKLESQRKEFSSLQEKFKIEFENIANSLLEKESEKFLKLNQNNLGTILNPLKDKIEEFKNRVESTYSDEVKERASLKTEVVRLLELNKQLSEDATGLANALKGESKTQGNWGEFQVELILEKAGLIKDIHYRKEEVLKDHEGQIKRPDFIINLPENKHFVIDSKVSLTAYTKYFNTENEDDRKQYLKEHLNSIEGHIKELSDKDYQNLHQIDSPDYVLMFMHPEPVLMLAIKEDATIVERAWEKNIILVTGLNLMLALRTIGSLWKHDKQKKNVLEIASQSGKLYDKFVGLVEDLITVGKKINDAKENYEEAMIKLHTGSGNLVKRVENIKKLGAKASKVIPMEILNNDDDDDEKPKSLEDSNP